MGHWSKVSCAALLLTLALCAPAAAATYPNVIVLVSGVESLTPFTTPDPSCAGEEGNAWSPMVAPTLKGAQLAVFTAPVAPNEKSNPSCTAGGPDVTSAMEINSNGDVDANGLALSQFLTFLQQSYGVATVQLVGHSDGGLWSRSAITQLQGGPAILSLTTIGTPHTGAWVADVATHASNFPCTGLKNASRCAAARAVAKIVFAHIGENAIYELSSPYLETWNPQQAIGACPVTTLAGTASDNSVFSGASLYYNPSDGLVGEASGLNQDAEALDGSTIPAAPGLDVVARQTFPDFHTPALGEPDELSDAALAAVVLSAVRSGATNTTTCGVVGVPAPPPPPPVAVQLRTGSGPSAGGQLPPTRSSPPAARASPAIAGRSLRTRCAGTRTCRSRSRAAAGAGSPPTAGRRCCCAGCAGRDSSSWCAVTTCASSSARGTSATSASRRAWTGAGGTSSSTPSYAPSSRATRPACGSAAASRAAGGRAASRCSRPPPHDEALSGPARVTFARARVGLGRPVEHRGYCWLGGAPPGPPAPISLTAYTV
jgi:triacylglycerol lipase